MAKYVFVTGGVVSGLGKGITAASLGRLLKSRGYKVTLQKIDPFFNVDSSNLSPYQHGEIFVTEDGSEVGLVVGRYERMIDEILSSANDVTSGKIYSSVISKERQGYYNGRTVQVVPHITDEIKAKIRELDKDNVDIIITEIGGTAGDIECHPFLEAIRQFQTDQGRANVAFVHVTLVPFIEMSGEQKTKPTQHSVKELQNVGIQPDIIVCRSEYKIDESSKKKLSLFCNVSQDCIIQNLTAGNIYTIPLKLEEEGFAKVLLRRLKLEDRPANLADLEEFCQKAEKIEHSAKKTRIAVVGKYTKKHDAYVSLRDALLFSGVKNNTGAEIDWLSSEEINDADAKKLLGSYDGVIIPAGFGDRGFNGKIATAKFCRENDMPVLMFGLGAQAGIIEFARNACGITNADSAEFSSGNVNHVVSKISSDEEGFKKGAHKTILKKGSLAAKIYSKTEIFERHRHKYEINQAYSAELEKSGLILSGHSESGVPEVFELKDHKFYLGVIYHPEFSARINNPSPVIDAFLKSCKK